MTMTLRPGLASALSTLGFDWPDSDEDKLEAMGHVWRNFATTLDALIDEADKQAHNVWTTNSGFAITAFKDSWLGAEAPVASLREGANAARLIGEGCIVAAAIVTALKLTIVAQVTVFARRLYIAGRVAKSWPTAVAAAAAIIVARHIAQAAIEEAIALALRTLEDG